MMYKLAFIFVLLIVLKADAYNNVINDDVTKELIDEFIESAMECASIPGLTLSVVKDGQNFMAEGYGVKDLIERGPATNETLFLLASVTKAMTGVTAAIVLKNEAENDALTWRTPVQSFLASVGKEFYFNDTLRSQLVNLRDLFGHR